MNKAPQASPWTQPRTCVVCGAEYTLEQHRTTGARAVAQGLEAGISPAVLGPEISKCPACLGDKRLSEQEAVAAALALGRQLRDDSAAETMRYVRRGAMMVACLAFCAALLIFSYANLRKDYNPWFGYALCAITGFAAIGAFMWARSRTGRPGD